MKKLLTLLLFITISISLIACNDEPEDPTDPIDPIDLYDFDEINPLQDIYYQIFVRSFADSDGDGVGDLNGITQNLDYLEELGITALWLLPVHPSPSYHGYDVTDYYGINSDYGTMEDFENLIDAANEKDIKIVMDLVINHTSDQHPWFIDAISSTSSPYRDYYVFNNGVPYSYFVGGMMDLNFENPDVIDEIYNIVDFYLAKGVHGFRLDAAMHFIEGINADWENTLFLLNLKAHMEENYPNSYILPEVFVPQYSLISDYYIGSDSLFNFYFRNEVMDKIGMENSRFNFVSNLNRAYDTFRDVDPEFIDAPILGNHDVNRIASSQGFINQPDKLALAARVLMTLPGNPFIYYGDELGMKGYRYEGANIPGYGIVYDEYRRQPFMWGSPTYETYWLPSDGSNDDTADLETQKLDESSLFNTYKTMIEIRRDNPALMYGNYFEPYNNNVLQIQGYVRYYEHETFRQAVLVLHNMTPDPYQVDVEYLEFIYGDSLVIDGYGSIILEIDPDLLEDYI
jgi:glycosidase